MSEPRDLDLRAQINRIDRDQAEVQKLLAETRKLTSEARKLDRERWLSPALAIANVIGGLLGVAAFTAKLIS